MLRKKIATISYKTTVITICKAKDVGTSKSNENRYHFFLYTRCQDKIYIISFQYMQ